MEREEYLLLALDIGAGTMDVLLWSEDMLPANCPRMVMPSPSVLVGRRIDEIAGRGEPVHLEGWLMGGGASSAAIRRALENGIPVTATPDAALTLHDNLDKVRSMGVSIMDEAPPGAARVIMRDVDLEALQKSFSPWGIALPAEVAVAVQDHGFSPQESNRISRFRHWKRLLEEGNGKIADLYPPVPPDYMTRMHSVRKQAPGALVIDTGPAAILGALEDDDVAAAASGDGATVINFGNAHTIAFLIREKLLHGLFEYHTRALLDEKKLKDLIAKLRSGELTNEEIFQEGGHGAIYTPGFKPGGFDYIAATGPRRAIAKGFAHFAAPHGDMMLTGCFGLVRAWKNLLNRS